MIRYAIVLAGGMGERLGSTEKNPKPLQKVSGRPMVEWVVRQLVSKGVERVVMAVGFGEEAVREHFGEGEKFGCKIEYIVSTEGTARAFLEAQELVDDNAFLVLNGDTYCEYDLGYADTDGGGIWVWWGVGEGMAVDLSREGKIEYGGEGSGGVFAGVVLMTKKIEVEGGEPTRFEGLLHGRRGFLAVAENGKFWDIGTPEKLKRARVELHLVLPMRYAEWAGRELVKAMAKNNEEMAIRVGMVADEVRAVLGTGGKVMVVGNGGSMAEAQHFAVELQNGLGGSVGMNRVMVLGGEVGFVTARVNDRGEGGWESVFESQVEAWAEKGDVLVCLSTSGESENVLRAATKAREMGALVAGFCRKGSSLAEMMDMGVEFEEGNTQRIQEMTLVALHCVAEIVEAGQ